MYYNKYGLYNYDGYYITDYKKWDYYNEVRKRFMKKWDYVYFNKSTLVYINNTWLHFQF